jgi:phenylpyruvate tautomerase PptA (4-oxalocrotonate tautomerase family)
MPICRLETREGWIAGRHAEVIDAIHRAMIETIRIPVHDRDIRILEYPVHAFAPPPGSGPGFAILEITLLVGRSPEAKRRLYAALTAEMAAFGLAPTDLKILLNEISGENWGLGGKAVADIDVGFKIDV